MPYVNRSYRNYNRRPRTARRVLRGKPTADKNKSAIYALTKKVNKINKKVGDRNMDGIFSKTHDIITSANYSHMQLLLPTSQPGESAMSQVFQTDSSILSRQALDVKSISTLWQVYPNNEEEPIDFAITLLAPKNKNILNTAYNPLTGALSLVEGTDYTHINGLFMINKQRWKIHYYKRTQTVSQDGPEGTEFPIASNKGYIKLNNLNWKIHNTTGNWDDVPSANLPYYMRLFLVVFNNNSGTDLEFPKFKQNTIIQGLVHD